jgi:hypothetical protein
MADDTVLNGGIKMGGLRCFSQTVVRCSTNTSSDGGRPANAHSESR